MTQADYVADQGQSCIRCRSTNLSFEDGSLDVGTLREAVECLACGAAFVRVFSVTAYEVDAP